MLFVCIRTEWAGEKAAKGGRNCETLALRSLRKSKGACGFRSADSTCLP